MKIPFIAFLVLISLILVIIGFWSFSIGEWPLGTVSFALVPVFVGVMIQTYRVF